MSNVNLHRERLERGVIRIRREPACTSDEPAPPVGYTDIQHSELSCIIRCCHHSAAHSGLCCHRLTLGWSPLRNRSGGAPAGWACRPPPWRTPLRTSPPQVSRHNISLSEPQQSLATGAEFLMLRMCEHAAIWCSMHERWSCSTTLSTRVWRLPQAAALCTMQASA